MYIAELTSNFKDVRLTADRCNVIHFNAVCLYIFIGLWLGLWRFQQYFIYIVAFSFIGLV
jgi:hypothetical protein